MVCCSNQSEILAYHYTPKLVFKPEADPLTDVLLAGKSFFLEFSAIFMGTGTCLGINYSILR